jgi:hypothetical protein
VDARLVVAIASFLVLLSGFRYLLGFGQIPHSCDLKYDFVSAHWVAQGRSPETLDRPTADREGVRLGADPGPFWDGPAQTHPPPSLLLVRPFTLLPYRAAAWAWAGLSALALAGLARLLLALWRRSATLPSWRASAPLTLALLLWPPAVFNFAYGQASALLTLAIAATAWNLERGRDRRAAGWLAAAMAVRLTPAVLLGHLALRARSVAAGAAAAFAGVALVALPLTGGLAGWRVFFASSAPAVRLWEVWTDNTVSLRGIFVRLFRDSAYVRAPFDHPALAHGLATAGAAALVVLAVVFGRKRARGNEDAAPAFAAWSCLVVLLNPLSWTHGALVLLVPAALLGRAGNSRGCRVAAAVSLVLLTIPRDTLFQLAGGERPYPASRGWVLGLHALGGLILFGAACVASARRSAAAPARAEQLASAPADSRPEDSRGARP